MGHAVTCLTADERRVVREVIDTWGLWWEEDEPPSRMSPPLLMRGWTIEASAHITPLVGVGLQRDVRKVLVLPADAPLSVQATVIAHTLAHDVLGHRYETDLITTAGVRHLICNRGVHPAWDSAAAAAASLMLIPDRYATSGLSAREIASWCGVPTSIVVRRLTGTVIREDEPPSIIRLDQRRRLRDEPPSYEATSE